MGCTEMGEKFNFALLCNNGDITKENLETFSTFKFKSRVCLRLQKCQFISILHNEFNQTITSI